MNTTITQQELERLLKESEQIVNDWDTYLQFQQNRDAVLKNFLLLEGLN
jgi:hypothetical protein